MSEELKPCPFCGCQAQLISWISEGLHYYRVICPKCFIGTLVCHHPEPEIKAWNRRAKENA